MFDEPTASELHVYRKVQHEPAAVLKLNERNIPRDIVWQRRN